MALSSVVIVVVFCRGGGGKEGVADHYFRYSFLLSPLDFSLHFTSCIVAFPSLFSDVNDRQTVHT